MKKIYILLLSLLTLCSCEEQKITGALFSKSFLQGFIDIKEIVSGNISNNDELYFMFQGENIARGNPLYDELCTKYGDVSYNRYMVPFSNPCLVDTITSLDLICNTDFDNNHKKGSSLNDIAILYYSSPLEFIKSGYKEYPKTEDTTPTPYRPSKEYYPYSKSFSDLKGEELILLYQMGYIKFLVHYKVDKVSLLGCRQNQEKQSQLILNLTLPQQGNNYSFEYHKISRVLIGPGFIYAST